jgi:hypothetical protein
MSPNKIIFQIGILAFCITAIVLGVQNASLTDTVTRSFIVFVGAVLTVALALVASSMLISQRSVQSEQRKGSEKPGASREAAAAKRQEKPAA